MEIQSRPPSDDFVETHQGSIWHGMIWILIALVTVFAIFESLPLFAKKIPWRCERRLFRNLRLQSINRECKIPPEPDENLQKIVKRLYPIYPDDRGFSIEVSAIAGKDVNAFAFLAGRIFVYSGLIREAQSDEEVAAVLAHEIEHVRRRHITQGMIQYAAIYLGTQFIFPNSDWGSISGLMNLAARLKFSRNQEDEADEGALERLKDAKVSVAGFKNFFDRRAASSSWQLISDHPSDEARSHLADQIPAFHSEPVLAPEEWHSLKQICEP